MNPLQDISLEKKMRRQQRKRSGFTLIEILVVIAILGILVSVAAVKAMAYFRQATIDTAALKIHKLADAVDAYYLQNRKYPEELILLVEPEEENKEGVLKKSALYDPWKNEFQYTLTEGDEHPFTLTSWGPDGNEGTEDDIDYWELEEMDPEEEER